MSEDVDDFEELIKGVREGSQQAAWDLVEHYSPELLRVVRRRMPDKLRREFDEEDFVQAAWKSVFTHRSRLARFHKPQEFMAFLFTVVGNQIGEQSRRRLTGKHRNTAERERVSIDGKVPHQAGSVRDDATPSRLASAREQWFQILEDQPEHYRQMIELRFQGDTYQEIADKVGVNERTVRRVLDKILERSLA